MIELGLQRITRLLAKTPLPWRAIHVAGTNGKGSICAAVSSMLDAYNDSHWRSSQHQVPLKHARFTSPHLVDRWDCISINLKTIPFSVFDAAEKRVLERNSAESIGASEFELLTATAFEIFAQEKVDVGVVEVGMGGRLDATNILGQPDSVNDPQQRTFGEATPITLGDSRPPLLVTAISKIGLDHQAFLGNTLEEIAREKAGIMKQAVPVVYDASNDDRVVDVLRSAAKDIGSPMIDASSPEVIFHAIGLSNSSHNLLLEGHEDGIASTEHVRQNVLVAFHTAWLALERLGRLSKGTSSRGPPMENSDMQKSLSLLAWSMLDAAQDTQVPGRQQRVNIKNLTGRKEDVLLDGAHNHQSALALAPVVEQLRRTTSDGAVTWVLAASNSKDATEILSPLIKDRDVVFAVEFGPVDGMPWVKPLEASRVLEAARAVVSSPSSLITRDCGKDILSALGMASEKADGGPLIIAGSLYLVGDVLRLLRGDIQRY